MNPSTAAADIAAADPAAVVTDAAVTDAAVTDADLVVLAGRLAPVLAALADANRLAILLAITRQPRSVKALTEVVGLPQTLVSHHLKALRDVGIVVATAKGRSNIYSMCCGVLAEPARLLATLAAYDEAPAASRDTPAAG